LPVCDGTGKVFAYLDMGWEELKVAVEYDGEQHRTDRRQYVWDVRRRELLDSMGWIVVRVVVGDRREDIVRRVREAIGRRASHQRDIRRPA
jgi:very-short-patch-repair endonuclease